MKPFMKPGAAKDGDKTMPAMTLPELCSEAADHVAKARLSLSDDGGNADRALLHLDEAILCLRRLLAHGRSSAVNGERTRPRSG